MGQQKSDRQVFLSHWFQGSRGQIEIRIFPEKIKELFPIDAYREIEAFLSQYPKSNIFACPCTRNGSEGAIESIPGPWINLPFEIIPEEKATKLLKEYPLPPCFKIRTGSGMESYWRFTEPIKDIQLLEQISTRLRGYFGIDGVFDTSEALRLPNTRNWEYNPPRAVWLLTHDEVTYEPDAFLRIGNTDSPDEGSPGEEEQSPEQVVENPKGLTPKDDSPNDMEMENNVTLMERQGEGTKFTIDRKIFSSDIWFDSPWKLKIWVYLIGNANHTDGHFMGIPIKRGQLIRSYRTIAKDCGYYIGYRFKKPSINTVRRICEGLMKDSRIVHRTVQPGTLVSICNYNSLQPFPKQRKVQRKVEQVNNTSTTPVHNKNVKNVKNEKPYSLNSDEFRLSELLLSLIVERRNGFKRPDIQKWAGHIDLMLRVDKRDPEEIERVIKWCQGDEFWQNNILSTAKLRKQFDALAMKMSEGKPKEEPTPPYYRKLT